MKVSRHLLDGTGCERGGCVCLMWKCKQVRYEIVAVMNDNNRENTSLSFGGSGILVS